MAAGCKKSACTLGDELIHLVEGSADRNDLTADIFQDPDMERKILSKIEALKERLLLWTRRLNESVYLNKTQRISQCFTQFVPMLHSTCFYIKAADKKKQSGFEKK